MFTNGKANDFLPDFSPKKKKKAGRESVTLSMQMLLLAKSFGGWREGKETEGPSGIVFAK